MKKIIKIALGLLACVFVLGACNDSDDVVSLPSLAVDKVEETFPATGGKSSFVVEAAGEWLVSTNAAWLKVSPASGKGSAVCEMVADSSLVNELRTADIRIVAGSEVKNIVVDQMGFEKAIVPKEKEVEIEPLEKNDERYFETKIVTNVGFKPEIKYCTPEEGWLTIESEDVPSTESARPRTVTLRFKWAINAKPEERVAEINLLPTNSEDVLSEPAMFVVRQKAAVKIEDNRAGDSIALLTIANLLNTLSEVWDTSERINNWDGVTLWEITDEDLPCDEAVGRVRSVEYTFFKTTESIPEQIKHLRYLETLSLWSNTNTMLLSIDLGPEVCELEYLKNLTMFSYGLVSLPDEFVKLGDTLEELYLNANNFNEIPDVLTKENFPKLKVLCLVGNRRTTFTNLSEKEQKDKGEGIGLNFTSTVSGDNALRRLFLWDTLEELRLQNCYIEGELPDFEVGKEGVVAYSYDQEDVAARGDTLKWLVDNNMPKILPNMKMLAINLNFFTGELPQWMLYHPNLILWVPELLVFNQQEKGKNSLGESVGFTNAPTEFSEDGYFYTAFPLLWEKYGYKEELDEE